MMCMCIAALLSLYITNLIFLSEADAGFWRIIDEGEGHAKNFMLRILIFPQILLETKAINTNKHMCTTRLRSGFQTIVVLRI